MSFRSGSSASETNTVLESYKFLTFNEINLISKLLNHKDKRSTGVLGKEACKIKTSHLVNLMFMIHRGTGKALSEIIACQSESHWEN